MLQLHGENEHFGSLPSLRTHDHPRLSIITTDRPDSSQLVDLHIYIVPKKVWKDVQRLATNEAMEDAVSAGFVRVPPNMTIRELRKTIEVLCAKDSYFPQDYIYLRSVGRSMTKVKSKQEDELRVKNYRPPQTFAPEIYLLEGRQEDYAPPVSVSPSNLSICDLCGNHHGSGEHHDNDPSEYNKPRHTLNDLGRSPSRLTQNYQRQPVQGGRNYGSNEPVERQSYTKLPQMRSDPEDSSTHNLSKLKEEQERLRRRQAELERMRRAAEQKKAQTDRSDGDRSRSDAEDEAPKRAHASSFRGYNDRQVLQEQKRNTNSLERTRKPEEKKVTIKSQTPRPELRPRPSLKATPSLTKHDEPKPSNLKRTRLGGNNNDHENARHETSFLSTERSETNRSNSVSPISIKTPRTASQSDSLILSKTKDIIGTPIDSPIYQLSRNETIDHSDDEQHISIKFTNKSPSRSTPEMTAEEKIINAEIDLERRNAESKRRRQLEEEEEQKKKGNNHRRRDIFKGIGDDPDALRTRHQELRTRRLDLEKVREEVIKHLKNIHNRITLRRKEARDMWKKKYFNEKKKHPQLDERISTLKTELDQIHKKTSQTMEAEAKYAAQMGYIKEAEAGSSIAQITRINHENQDIRHQLEQAKLRLTTDVKLRNQAENECRLLKHELNQAKMNLNDIKSRAGP
ncbi:unnamed protein product [Adineta steineri]|uniref:Spermatogenesis-associated protein 1 C-terminal domain-containing protein n=1 Tax=Adineta steineri TaxID=433720 RepID=A0A814IER5_9BILA|nr:unnamed protein product [Adineta steineri]CAF1465759.1 unnamed protein product [Adineta steineri]CAF1521523.1 unnamed protein product [Adineta steineri]CAF1650426.1 unnamed protein product [Adineta steineri]